MISYLQVESLTKSYGDMVMFENISFQIAKDQKITLIAKNGAGKTTLFNILYGKDSPDSGIITFHKDIAIGFLEQEPVYDPANTIIEQIFHSSSARINAIRNYEESLESTDKTILQAAIEKMDQLQAWDYETKIKQILGKLKITDLHLTMEQLSGGQRKRVALAEALIDDPDLLIFDEPTNHLDIDMIEWLEEYLQNGNFTLLMVTHDRYFMDRVCSEIIEIDNKSLYQYHGNYLYYLEKRTERIENEQANVEKARNLMRKELDWIYRMPKARGTKAKYRLNAFEELKEQASAKRVEKQMNLKVINNRLGSKIINIEGLSKSFDEVPIITDFTYNFSRFEKAGIIGPNGSGKTTFLNLIAGMLKPDAGKIDIGETIKIGYYKQEGIQFDENMKVIDVATSIVEIVTLSDGSKMSVSQFLNYFLFSPEEQQSYVYKLSGGEKRRLYLMTVLMKNPNFLIFDEPTNDFDILSLNVLEEYLRNFKGCLLIVSHDRYFMDKIVDHLFIFQSGGIIKDFIGTYIDYRNYKIEKEQEIKKADKTEKKPASQLKKSHKPVVKKLTWKEQKEAEQLIGEIEQLEAEKRELEISISSGSLKTNELIDKSNQIGLVISLIDQKTERWMELSEMEK
jgi:ATP-binding cassette subfamily F protein uup